MHHDVLDMVVDAGPESAEEEAFSRELIGATLA